MCQLQRRTLQRQQESNKRPDCTEDVAGGHYGDTKKILPSDEELDESTRCHIIVVNLQAQLTIIVNCYYVPILL